MHRSSATTCHRISFPAKSGAWRVLKARSCSTMANANKAASHLGGGAKGSNQKMHLEYAKRHSKQAPSWPILALANLGLAQYWPSLGLAPNVGFGLPWALPPMLDLAFLGPCPHPHTEIVPLGSPFGGVYCTWRRLWAGCSN